MAATADSMKHYLADHDSRISPQATDRGVSGAREALRWFYRMALRTEQTRETTPERSTSKPGSSEVKPGSPSFRRSSHAPEASSDTGRSAWERDLVKAIRERGFLWRTEQTYREWGARFANFIAPLTPYAADGKEVAAFLSSLAVNQRASQSTQRQALNALVFLMQEALHRDLGEFKFNRSQRGPKIPTVLSQEECVRLFAAMSVRSCFRHSQVRKRARSQDCSTANTRVLLP
jgi:Phage integrase, N-terminal SAM-like domain